MAGEIHLNGRLICANDAQSALVLALMPEHIRLTRAEPGCLSFEVTRSDDPFVWTLAERFRDRAAFDAHQARTKASDWGQKSGAITRDFHLTEQPG